MKLPENEKQGITKALWNEHIDSMRQNTKKAFISDIKNLSEFSGSVKIPVLEKTLIAFIDYLILRELKLVTIKRNISAISKLTKIYNKMLISNGLSPVFDFTKSHYVKDKLININPQNQTEKKTPITKKMLSSLIGVCRIDKKGIRNKALLMVGYRLGNHSTYDLINIKYNDLIIDNESIQVILKTGEICALCPDTSRALRKWLAVSGIKESYVFRSMYKDGSLKHNNVIPVTVTRVIKTLATDHNKQIGGIFKDINSFSYLSMKAGFEKEFEAHKKRFFEKSFYSVTAM